MEESILKAVLSKSEWLIITIFILYLAFKIIMAILENKKAKTKEELVQKEFNYLKDKIEVIEVMANNAKVNERTIDSINQKLKIIYAQYGSELSRESAIVIIQNFYYAYAQHISNEIYELQKKNYTHKKIIESVKSIMCILNDEKMQELEGFSFRDKSLITFTSGQIIDEIKIMNIVDNFITMNGMLRREIENALSIEAGKIIKRFS
jgi:hypothetical protein